MDLEGTLVEKLRKLEALHAGTSVDGEKEAAFRAAEPIRARLAELRGREPDVEMKYSIGDPWMRQLFVALCRRYELKVAAGIAARCASASAKTSIAGSATRSGRGSLKSHRVIEDVQAGAAPSGGRSQRLARRPRESSWTVAQSLTSRTSHTS